VTAIPTDPTSDTDSPNPMSPEPHCRPGERLAAPPLRHIRRVGIDTTQREVIVDVNAPENDKQAMINPGSPPWEGITAAAAKGMRDQPSSL